MAQPDMVSRRSFLKATAASGTIGILADNQSSAAAAVPSPASPDFTRGSILHADRVVHSACQFCNSLCGLRVHLKGERVIDVQGEPGDPVQASGLCVKAELMPQLLYNRHRLTTPLRRVGGAKGSPQSQFAPCSGACTPRWSAASR